MGAGTEKISHEDTKARRFFGRVAKATQTRGDGNKKKNLRAPTRVRSLKKTKKFFDFLILREREFNFVLAFFFFDFRIFVVLKNNIQQ